MVKALLASSPQPHQRAKGRSLSINGRARGHTIYLPALGSKVIQSPTDLVQSIHSYITQDPDGNAILVDQHV